MKHRSSVLFPAIAFLLSLVTGANHYAYAQSKDAPPLRPFLVLIETTDEGFKLSCWKGCAWKELKFTLNPYQPQAINAYGTTTVGSRDSVSSGDLAGFLFTVKKTRDGVTLEGLSGTAWKEYRFDTPGHRERDFVTEYGTARLD